MDFSYFGLIPHHSKKVAVGDKFGRLKVLFTGKKPDSYKYTAICECECGILSTVRIAMLKETGSLKCTCNYDRTKPKQNHGLWKSPLYTVWWHMLRRCENPKDDRYCDYGGRGIKVCDRWHSLENFHADLIETYDKLMQLDRIDNDKGYSPENCKWSTKNEQMRNRRSNIFVTIDGDKKVLKDWAIHFGVNYHSVYHRIKKMGWEPEVALRTPFIAKGEPRLVRPLC